MKATELADKYQYSLPYSRQDVLDIYQEGYRQALADVLNLSNGEVINGTLQGAIITDKVEELIK
jgi:hypothetical protein